MQIYDLGWVLVILRLLLEVFSYLLVHNWLQNRVIILYFHDLFFVAELFRRINLFFEILIYLKRLFVYNFDRNWTIRIFFFYFLLSYFSFIIFIFFSVINQWMFFFCIFIIWLIMLRLFFCFLRRMIFFVGLFVRHIVVLCLIFKGFHRIGRGAEFFFDLIVIHGLLNVLLLEFFAFWNKVNYKFRRSHLIRFGKGLSSISVDEDLTY